MIDRKDSRDRERGSARRNRYKNPAHPRGNLISASRKKEGENMQSREDTKEQVELMCFTI